MRYVTLGEALALYRRLVEPSSGGSGIRDLGALEDEFTAWLRVHLIEKR